MKILRALAVAAGLALVVASLGAQEAAKYGLDPNYKVPRLTDGHPDLQGRLGQQQRDSDGAPAAVEGQDAADRRGS
jgi:hypothetical protein